MKAVVYHDIGDIRLEDVPEPKIEDSNDAVVRITSSAICGTDLHMVRGTMPGMEPGAILGHEGVGIVEDKGRNVRNFDVGDRVVIGSTTAGTVRIAGRATATTASTSRCLCRSSPPLDAYRMFADKKAGWMKVELRP